MSLTEGRINECSWFQIPAVAFQIGERDLASFDMSIETAAYLKQHLESMLSNEGKFLRCNSLLYLLCCACNFVSWGGLEFSQCKLGRIGWLNGLVAWFGCSLQFDLDLHFTVWPWFALKRMSMFLSMSLWCFDTGEWFNTGEKTAHIPIFVRNSRCDGGTYG